MDGSIDHDEQQFRAWLAGLTTRQRDQLLALLYPDHDKGMSIVQLMWRLQENAVDHWKANHDQLAARLRLFTQRPDLPVDRLPAYLAMAQYQDSAKALGAALHLAIERIKDMLHQDDGQAFKEVSRMVPMLEAALTLADGHLPELDEDFIGFLWSEAWNEALEKAGVGIGNVDVAHMQQPVIFARKLLATVFSPSPAIERHDAKAKENRERFQAALSRQSQRRIVMTSDLREQLRAWANAPDGDQEADEALLYVLNGGLKPANA